MIEIKITGESAQDALADLAALAANFFGGNATVTPAAATTTKKRTAANAANTTTAPDPEPNANIAAANTVTPKHTLEELQELNGKVDDKPAIKKLVNSFSFSDPANPGATLKVERMTQLEKKDYDAYAAGVQLLIDNQV